MNLGLVYYFFWYWHEKTGFLTIINAYIITLFNMVLEILATAMKQEKKKHIGKEEIKLYLQTTWLSAKNPKESTKKFLGLISELIKFARYKKNTPKKRSIALLCTKNEHVETEN